MKKIMILALILTLVLSGCSGNPEKENELNMEIESLYGQLAELEKENGQLRSEIEILTAEPVEEISLTLLETATEVITLIKNQDMVGLSSHVDPSLGLRFSPYSYVDFSSDLLFTPSEVSGLMTDPTIYNWGDFDGSGEPINLSFVGYYGEFVYDQDFYNPHIIGNNTIIGTGNMINNVTTMYPTASFVEYHFTGFNPTYSGMDWASLRLIFENVSGAWKLVGIEHDQWTI